MLPSTHVRVNMPPPASIHGVHCHCSMQPPLPVEPCAALPVIAPVEPDTAPLAPLEGLVQMPRGQGSSLTPSLLQPASASATHRAIDLIVSSYEVSSYPSPRSPRPARRAPAHSSAAAYRS